MGEWKLVPPEPTDAMLAAVRERWNLAQRLKDGTLVVFWKAMFDAAPGAAPPAEECQAVATQGDGPADDADGVRYRWLCAHPDWHFIEAVCREFVADSSSDFYARLSHVIDTRRAVELDPFEEHRAIATPQAHKRDSHDIDLRAELDSVLADWNSLVKAIGSKTNGGAVGHATALVKAARQALEAMERMETRWLPPASVQRLRAAISALRAALPEKP